MYKTSIISHEKNCQIDKTNTSLGKGWGKVGLPEVTHASTGLPEARQFFSRACSGALVAVMT